MLLEHKIGIGGRLVGIGKERLDGSKEYRWLDKPIHNTIVASGFDQLFKFSPDCDSDTQFSNVLNNRITFTGNHRLDTSNTPAYGRYGELSFCRIGTDGTATSSSDTNLHSACSGYSATVVSGVPWTYAFLGQDGNGDYRIRITHRVTATADATVREIGWFGAQEYKASYYSDWSRSYLMFSRIVLAQPYEVANGEQVIVTYELTIKYADLVPVAVNMGIDAADGTPLRAMRQFESNIVESTSSDIAYVSSSRFGLLSCSQDDVPGMSAHYSVVNQAVNRVTYSLTDREFAADRNISFASLITKPTVTPIVTKGAMVAGSGSRMITFSLPVSWPNLSDSVPYADIHMLNIDGYTYRFGYYDSNDQWVPQAWRKNMGDAWSITEQVSYVQN